jgi:tRNA (guanine37-N1)-methyltransferase
MNITILSLFPQIPEVYFSSSIAARAAHKNAVNYKNIYIREYAHDKHRKCDDSPFGGGAGMVLKAEPLSLAIEANRTPQTKIIYPSPSGKVFTQETAVRLAAEDDIMLIAGRYEGVDQRIIDKYVDEEISLGDYVMASGELSSLVIIDAIIRLVKGVINNESLEEESFSNGLLEYPHYTRPETFMNMQVPEILLSGNHEAIRKWRLRKSVEKTLANRPDFVHNGIRKSDEVEKIIAEITAGNTKG